MENNVKLDCRKNEEILKIMIDIILEIHPIVEDRLTILYPSLGEPRTPEMEIHFDFYKNDDEEFTQIIFLDGNCSYKSSGGLPQLYINGLLSKEVLCCFISYLLTDHDNFKNIYKHNSTIDLLLDVDGRDENMHGISCGEITLKLDFLSHDNRESLANDYLDTIVTRFFDKLKKTEYFKEGFSKYCSIIKADFVNFSDIDELRNFIDLLSYDDLCNVIKSIPDIRFIELYDEYINKSKLKVLTKN